MHDGVKHSSQEASVEVVMDATSRMDVKSKELSGEKNLVSWPRVDIGDDSNPFCFDGSVHDW